MYFYTKNQGLSNCTKVSKSPCNLLHILSIFDNVYPVLSNILYNPA